MDNLFHSQTYGDLTLELVKEKIAGFIAASPEDKYQIVIGSDSLSKNSEVDFVSAIVVHRQGSGAIYFWQREVKNKKYVLRERIYEEASLSLELANRFVEVCLGNGISKYDLEIHVDIGKIGDTREMLNEVVGMVRGSGFVCKVKPDSYAASKVADRHT